jgi:hypothetical protein
MFKLPRAIFWATLASFVLLIPKTEASEQGTKKTTQFSLLAQFIPELSNRQAELKLTHSVEQVETNSSMSQINSVEQLKDISPTDWSYEALRNLVERYGCLSGFSDLTYRGKQTISRAEFAAGLNACLGKIENLITTSESVSQQEIDTLLKLMQEFQSDLALLQGKTDGNQARVEELEANQFSATTKLKGEAIFSLSSILARDKDNNSILGDRIRLDLETSFNGSDLLLTRFSAGNFPSFSEVTGTFAGNLAFAEPTNNDFNLEVLFYSFNVNENTNFILGATGTAADDIVNTVNILDGDGEAGAISRFGTRNPIYFLPSDSGLGIVHRPLESLEISAGYLAANTNESRTGSGLFDGPFSALGQILFSPTHNLNFAATYIHSYNQSNTETGSNLANLKSLIDNSPNFGKTISTISDSYGVEWSWAIGDRLIIGGWGALSKVTNLSTLGEQINRGTQDIWNWSATLALPDLGKEGNIAGIIVGMEPFVSNSTIKKFPKDRDSSLHLEAFYQYQVNSNISITPGVVWITAPDNNSNNKDLFIGTIRTTFRF